MRLAETVTFGGSSLDRRADLRDDVSAIRVMAGDPAARAVAVWNGKIAMTTEPRLALLPPRSAIFDNAGEGLVFLGVENGAPVFASDVSGWMPKEGLPDTLGAFHDPSRQVLPGVTPQTAFCELRAVMARLSPRGAELAATAKAVLGWHDTHRYCARCGDPTVMSGGGWRRDCLACGGQHFPRTDPVVIMLITRGNSVLLGRSPGWPEGMYSLLAGFIEPGEPMEAAVRREVLEETGIHVGRITYLASQPWPFPSSLMFGCHAEALEDEITLDRNELEDAFWISREDMMEVVAGRHPRLRAPRHGAIAGFILNHWLRDRLD